MRCDVRLRKTASSSTTALMRASIAQSSSDSRLLTTACSSSLVGGASPLEVSAPARSGAARSVALSCSTAEIAALARAHPVDVGFVIKYLSRRSESAKAGSTRWASSMASSHASSSETQSRRAQTVSRLVDGCTSDERR